MNALARPPLAPLRRARLAALAVCLFVAFPFSALPLVGSPTVERTAPDDAPDAESDRTDGARPDRAERTVSSPVAVARLPFASRPPVSRSASPPLDSAAVRGLYPLRC